MSSIHNHQLFKKSQARHHKRKLGHSHTKKSSTKVKKTSSAAHCHQLLRDLKTPGARFVSYTISELEPICQQIAIQRMSSSTQLITTCPWICLFCENLIYEPITLYCGHTYCEQCIKDEEYSSLLINCPRCPKDIQEQIQSPIAYAKEKLFSKNHFLKQVLERTETVKFKCENIVLCHRAQNEYANKNYQQAIDIYSNILEKYDDEHIAFYGRAKAYLALGEFDKALDDVERVIVLKSHWAKGYYCRSEILFEMKRFTAALLSSLQGLTLDPEDQIGKQIMARHLHAVLHESDDQESAITMDTETDTFAPPSDHTKEIITSDTSNTKLLMCRSTQSTTCLCSFFDGQNLRVRDFECSICVNLLWFPVTTPCGHVFCQECLIRSIDNTQAQCPMCKNSLEEFFPMLIQSHVNQTEIVSQIIESYFPNEYNDRRQLYEQENIQGASIPKSSSNNTESTIFEIPVFVCVLALPCSTCPLHVFEPRYRLMMRRTVETESRSFGMCQYDEETDSFADYGTLLYIRDLVYTQDGRSIVDTVGRQRFHVIDRGMKDGYSTARVQLHQDHPIEQEEFDELYQLNRDIYKRVRDWFEQLDAYRRALISRQLDGYPPCDDLVQGSPDGPSWTWIILNLLPIEPELQYTALSSQSFRIRLQMINNTMDFLLNHQSTTDLTSDET
jgi:Lon protease-like protein